MNPDTSASAVGVSAGSAGLIVADSVKSNTVPDPTWDWVSGLPLQPQSQVGLGPDSVSSKFAAKSAVLDDLADEDKSMPLSGNSKSNPVGLNWKGDSRGNGKSRDSGKMQQAWLAKLR